eukprot:TRINITY_DN48358_c0_g1_i1.p1 TRINITY_DN48358_c0_g1~~TRINITY_DN48358_c0_g1_i1.p1  ORF type:complete len:450 (-),score=75.54 TRINITY_DN48358_c0_g1_i1:88-1437(-)
MAAAVEDAIAPTLGSDDARKDFREMARSRSSRLVIGSTEAKPSNIEGNGLLAMLNHPLNVLLVFLPLGIASEQCDWGDVTTFWFNFLALVPLAKILGDATEELAAGLKSDMIAGLLNATFGNAVEVVIMIQTMRAGLLDVVKSSLLGSVLSNLLLVLGMSFFFGGIMGPVSRAIRLVRTSTMLEPKEVEYCSMVGEKIQKFSTLVAMVNTSMLLLACLVTSLITVFYKQREDNEELKAKLVPLSRFTSIVVILAYVAYIFFQLGTHKNAMSEEENAHSGGAEPEEELEDEQPAVLSIPTALTVMVVTTLIVSYGSEKMVDSLSGVVEKLHISQHFIGIILLPIVGNACEHMSAIRFAIQDKPGLSIGIAVGSSTQIALFVVPMSVMIGWCIGQPMDLYFGLLNTTVLSISVICVLSIVVDGTATWLVGYLLVSAYAIVGLLYWHLPNHY